MDEKSRQFSEILEHLADDIDVSPSNLQLARERYAAVANWLGAKDSPLLRCAPVLYPQGSFRLGTMVKPIGDSDEFDVDLVCELRIGKSDITQEQLKNAIGDRIKANETYKRMLEQEGRRCWTLAYADGANFHMDILPALPESREVIERLVALGVAASHASSAICITDREDANYGGYDLDWPKSNPKGYADWFTAQMEGQFSLQRQVLAKQRQRSIDEVPEHEVKTTLQRAIQILKRHRDQRFEANPDDKPISVIITTLAALAYDDKEIDLYSVLVGIIERIEQYAETRMIQRFDGEWWIPNPVNPGENFADGWHEDDDKKAKAFFRWLDWIKQDLETAINQEGLHKMAASMEKGFGRGTVERTLKRLGHSYEKQREDQGLKMAVGTGTLGAAGTTVVRSHTFYGD